MIGGSNDGGTLMARQRQWGGWEGADSGGVGRGLVMAGDKIGRQWQ